MTRIFISLRKPVRTEAVTRILRTLVERFGEAEFVEGFSGLVDNRDAQKEIERRVSACPLMLVFIDPNWLEAGSENGLRYLDQPGDGERMEIEAALRDGTQVVPVLVEDVMLPLKSQLPESMAALVDCQEWKVRPEPYYRLDLKRFVEHLDLILIRPDEVDTEDLLSELDDPEPGLDRQRYRAFVSRGVRGKPEDVDFLMESLASQEDMATAKLVDYALGLVKTRTGLDRIQEFLYQGELIQRNYAALVFKRRGMLSILDAAVAAGAVDRDQAYSK